MLTERLLGPEHREGSVTSVDLHVAPSQSYAVAATQSANISIVVDSLRQIAARTRVCHASRLRPRVLLLRDESSARIDTLTVLARVKVLIVRPHTLVRYQTS